MTNLIGNSFLPYDFQIRSAFTKNTCDKKHLNKNTIIICSTYSSVWLEHWSYEPKVLGSSPNLCITSGKGAVGAVAQTVERLLSMQEVEGSMPSSSTPLRHNKHQTRSASMPERSKGADLRSAVFVRVGSNPTRCKGGLTQCVIFV